MTRPNSIVIPEITLGGVSSAGGVFDKQKYDLAVIDFETDPFKYQRTPKPFVVEFYCEDFYEVFWGDDCAEQLVNYLEKLPKKYRIYAHNGGKFDAHFVLKYISSPALIIKNRIVSCQLFQHNLRDSYAILPVPLSANEKMVFDYALMERPVRDKNRKSILEYLHSDCVSLFNMVKRFIDRYGPRMTIGGTAIRELQRFHPFIKQGSSHDATFRPYYHGGRVQVFKHGLSRGPFKYVDRNSMYPAAMKDKLHPINGQFEWSETMPTSFDMPFFMTFRGKNNNALPYVTHTGELVFTQEEGIFKACSHEIEVALEHKLIEIDEVLECLVSTNAISFGDFVDHYGGEKVAAKEAGDKIDETLAKLNLNSAYGRTGINPANFEDYEIFRDFGNEKALEDAGYSISCDYEDLELWSRPAEIKEEDFCDVAIAASITSASRANLLLNLQLADDPIYCDTDSIMCRDFHGDIHSSRIGAWDVEATFENVAIAGKKMYAGYSDAALAHFGRVDFEKIHTTPTCKKCKIPFHSIREKLDHEPLCKVKLSSKGGSLNLSEIVRICEGETIYYQNDAPTFSLRNEPTFIHRHFRVTGLTEVGA